MEYRCYIIGDPVTEPGALLRRLLYVPFPDAEERTLSQLHSLLYVRSEEAKGTTPYPMAVSPPNLHDLRSSSLTLPNPSMPSVDITVQFAVITEPHEFERVMLSHYAASPSTGGLGRSMRRSFSSPISSFQELPSSEASSMKSAAHGLALQSPPHAILLAFNPFSICSFSKLRVEWVHSLRVLRQHRQQKMNLLLQHQQQQQHPNRAASGLFAAPASPGPGSPLAVGYPAADALDSFPAVLLVATRMELLRDTMEATPSVHVPSALDVAEVALALQAQAYAEVGTNWDDTIASLRSAIARGCMGELTNAPVVTYNTAYRARQGSVARAIEMVQLDPYEEESMMGGGSGSGGLGDYSDSRGSSRLAALPDSGETGRVPRTAAASLPGTTSVVSVLPSDFSSGAAAAAAAERLHASSSFTITTNPTTAATTTSITHLDAGLSSTLKAPPMDRSDHDQCAAPRQAEALSTAEETEMNTKEAAARPQAGVEAPAGEGPPMEDGAEDAQRSAREGERDSAMQGASINTLGDNGSDDPSVAVPELGMRGRQLRRHLVTALAPLVLPAEKLKSNVSAGKQGGDPETATANAGHRQQQQPTEEPQHSSKWTWRHHPRTNQVFYVERATGRSQYERPEDYDGPPLPPSSPTRPSAAAVADSLSGERLAAAAAKEDTDDAAQAFAAAATRAGETDFREAQRSPRSPSPPPAAAEEAARTTAAARDRSEETETAVASTSAAVSHAPTDLSAVEESLSSWRQRQQLQLKHTQVQRLERQIQQLRLQSERLRAQSEANSELKDRVAALRSALSDKEQAFSARVAEQNEQLAKESLRTMLAVEELTAALAPGGGGGGGGVHAPMRFSKEVEELDVAIQEVMTQLRECLQQRDIAAEAVDGLQHRRKLVARRLRETNEELRSLRHRGLQLEETLLPLIEHLGDTQAEERKLREDVARLDELHVAAEQQRQRRLEHYVEQQCAAEAQARQLAQLRSALTEAQDRYCSTLRALQLPSRLRRVDVQEEETRLRLALEAATGQCARGLLESAQEVHRLDCVSRQLYEARQRIGTLRQQQRERVDAACTAAEEKQAQAVLARYRPPEWQRGEEDARPAISAATTTTQLVDVAVEAASQARAALQAHDTQVAAPLMEQGEAMQVEVLLLLRQTREEARQVGTAVSSGATATGEMWLPWQWLRAAVAEVCSATCQDQQVAAAVDAYLRYAAATPPRRLGDAGGAAGSSAAAVGRAAKTDASTLTTVVERSDHETALRTALLATCDQLVHRLHSLDARFVSSYDAMRPVAA